MGGGGGGPLLNTLQPFGCRSPHEMKTLSACPIAQAAGRPSWHKAPRRCRRYTVSVVRGAFHGAAVEPGS